jgi:hypothetical protein
MKLKDAIQLHEARIQTAEVMDPLPENPPRAWLLDEIRFPNGELRAYKICSAMLQTHLWVLKDSTYQPRDDEPIFYADELPLLRRKTVHELLEVVKVKIVFPGSRVVQ